jgi:hypothetical protein
MVTLEERDERSRGTAQPFPESGKEEQEKEEEH